MAPKTIMGEDGAFDVADFGITREHADIALRTLQIVQVALTSPRFGLLWRAGAHRPSDAVSAKCLIVRRVWMHALLANEWLSAKRLARICKRSLREVCADKATVEQWAKQDAEFDMLLHGIEELVDASVAAMTAAPRFYRVAARTAKAAGLARRQTRAKLPPPPVAARIVAQGAGSRREQTTMTTGLDHGRR